jgi:sugar phosphate isomerase/epimerase
MDNHRGLSMTTIYQKDNGSPEPYLRGIAEAGFSHVHWSHHWSTDFIYSTSEITQIVHWLKQYSLQALDMHATHGREKRWDSQHEYRRLAGVELVRNRLEMAARLGAGAIVLHAYPDQSFDAQRQTLSELEPVARLLGVRIALENLFEGNRQRLAALFAEFGPEYLGFCYDTGHGNMVADGFEQLEAWKERLAVLHIHDNDGAADQHKLPFTAAVDWERFMSIVRQSAYTGPLSLESTMGNHKEMTESDFLQAAYRAGERLEGMR